VIRRGLGLLVGAACAVVPAVAQAGSYDVVSCSIDGGFYPNNAWVAGNNPPGDPRYLTDTGCTQPGDPLATSLAPNNSFAANTFARLWFYTPSGTRITDFKVVMKHYWFAPPLPNNPTEHTYTLASFGGVFYSGTGRFAQTDQDALANEGHWYGYRGAHQSGAAETAVMTMTRSSSNRALAAPPAAYLTISAGCWTDDVPTCTLAANATAFLQLFGSRVTISDDTLPSLPAPVAGQGLLAAGTRAGDEPVIFNATDNVGIRRAELVDVTDASNPAVVVAKDYAGGAATGQGTRCDFTRPRPCPDLRNETIAASSPLAGHRTLLLRITDAAGNQTVSAPFSVVARGPLNGVNGGDGARLTAGFPGHVFRGRGKARRKVGVLRPAHTVKYGDGDTVRGILRGANGQPVSGGQVRLLVRELRLGAAYVDRGAVTSGADGRFQVRIPGGPSRLYRLAYKAYPGDDGFAAKSDLALNVRARIQVGAARHIGSRGVARFTGRLVGGPFPPRGVTLELQAFQHGRGWRTVKTMRTRKQGFYSTSYRFASRHGRFGFRVRLRPNDSYPYARGNSRTVHVSVG
jgi:hypothetical protein